MKLSYIFFILAATLLIITIVLMCITPQSNKEVKCYDKYSNEIIGTTCINHGYPEDIKNYMVLSIVIGFMLTMSGCIIMMGENI